MSFFHSQRYYIYIIVIFTICIILNKFIIIQGQLSIINIIYHYKIRIFMEVRKMYQS